MDLILIVAIESLPVRPQRLEPFVEPLVLERTVDRPRMTLPPDPARIGRVAGCPSADAARNEQPDQVSSVLSLLHDDRANPSPDVRIGPLEQTFHVLRAAGPEVPGPSTDVAVEPLETRLQRLPPVPRRERAGFATEVGHGAFREPGCHVATFRRTMQNKAEEMDLFGSAHRALRPVYLQAQSRLDVVRQAGHHPEGGTFAADINVEVVGVADEGQTSALQLPIQLVEHDIGEERRERATLRCPFLGCRYCAVRHDHRRREHSVHELQEFPVLDALTQSSQEALVVHPVEELREVDRNDPGSSVAQVLFCFLDGGEGALATAKPVAALVEVLVEDRVEDLECCLLNDAVDDVRDAEPSLASPRFWDPNSPDVSGAITSFEQGVPQAWDESMTLGDGLCNALAVDSACSLVSRDVQQRGSEISLRCHST